MKRTSRPHKTETYFKHAAHMKRRTINKHEFKLKWFSEQTTQNWQLKQTAVRSGSATDQRHIKSSHATKKGKKRHIQNVKIPHANKRGAVEGWNHAPRSFNNMFAAFFCDEMVSKTIWDHLRPRLQSVHCHKASILETFRGSPILGR